MKKNIYFVLALLLILPNVFSQKVKKFSFFETDSKTIYDFCFTPKGDAIGIADNKTIKVFSVESKALLKEFKTGHDNRIMSVDISKDGKLLVSGDQSGKIVIWDFDNNKILKTLNYHKGLINSLKISPDGNYIVSGGNEKKVFVYDIKTDSVIHTFTDHKADITDIEFSPDGRILVTASGDKTIKVYNGTGFEFISSLTGHKGWVRGISFSKDGKKMMSCGDDADLLVWNITNIHEIRQLSTINTPYSWLSCVTCNNEENESYAYADIAGNVKIMAPTFEYHSYLFSLITRMRFIHTESLYYYLAVATKGRGVIFLIAK